MKSNQFMQQLKLFIITVFLSLSVHAADDPFAAVGGFDDSGLGGGGDDILPVEQAFQLDTRTENGQVIASWKIADGHYLYRDKVKITPAEGNPVTTGELVRDAGELKHDEVFGDVYVYHHAAEVRLPVTATNGATKASFKVKYQGCSEVSGICYPPQTQVVDFDLSMIGTAQAATETPATPQVADEPVSEQDAIANSLKSGNTWLTVVSFFGFGLLLAFTPCIFPMIPILSSIIVGQGEKISTGRAFWLSLVYVLAMAVTYTVAGVIAGASGDNIQAAFQNPWVLSAFALVFVLLALSMFGFYDLQMPSAIQSKLTNISNRQQGGSITGVAIMGFLSALIVGPCVAAPLAGALIYIGQTGDMLLGGIALFALSMGMGAPLIAIGTSAGKLLPRAGMWMDAVKAVFGVLLLGVAIWMLERIIPETVSLILWAALLIVSAIYMGALEGLKAESNGWNRLWKGVGLIILTWGIVLLIGAAAGSKDMFQPLRGLGVAGTGQAQSQQHLAFRQIKGVDGLDQALAEARQNNQTVMLDFYADWCISCKEMEKFTFSDPTVQQALAGTMLLQADVTDNDEKDKALYQKFGIIGPPAIIFYNGTGEEKQNFRVVGYMPADTFTGHVKRALK